MNKQNVPQLFCQLLYVYGKGGEATSNTILAFTASLLAVVAATLSYFVDRDNDETIVVQYYLATKCHGARRDAEVLDDILDDFLFWGDLEDDDHELTLHALPSASPTTPGSGTTLQLSPTMTVEGKEKLTLKSPASSTTMRHGITLQEKQNLMANRGRTLSLAIDISEVFGSLVFFDV